jgi:hypothetical protein
MCQDDEEAVPVVSQRDDVEDIATKGFHRVEVVHWDPKELLRQPVVDDRYEVLIVRTLFPARHHVVSLIELVEEARNLVRRVL